MIALLFFLYFFPLSYNGIIVSPFFSLFPTFPMFLLYRDLLLIVPKNTDETEDLHRLLPK